MSDDDSASVVGALFGLDGFEVLSAGEIDGELNVLVQTTAELVAAALWGGGRAQGPPAGVGAGSAAGRAAGGAVLVKTRLVLPAPAVPGQDLDRAAPGDRASGQPHRAGSGLGVCPGGRAGRHGGRDRGAARGELAYDHATGSRAW